MDMRDDFYKGSVMWQLEKVNAERAIAVKALQEIEGYLFKVTTRDEDVLLAYMAASVALEKIDWPKEEE
jgi:hypothetical protein